jgi:phosphoglycerate dehydrogenase-like enzyme
MKVLVADKLDSAKVACLEELGATIDLQPGLSAEDLPAAIQDAEILIVRSTKVSAQNHGSGLIARADHSRRCRDQHDRR